MHDRPAKTHRPIRPSRQRHRDGYAAHFYGGKAVGDREAYRAAVEVRVEALTRLAEARKPLRLDDADQPHPTPPEPGVRICEE